MLAKKRSFSKKYAKQQFNWNYDFYISEINRCFTSCTRSETPTITKLSEPFKTTKFLSYVKNKICYCGFYNNIWTIQYLNGNYEQISLPYLDSNYISKMSYKQTPSMQFTFFSTYDGKAYIMDDIFGTNFRLLATTGITNSQWNGASCIDYTGKYLYCWQQDSSNGKIAKIEISTGNMTIYTLAGVTWSYPGLVLPDGSFIMSTIGQYVHKFNNDFSSSSSICCGSYAGWAQGMFILRDQKISFLGGGKDLTTSYIDFNLKKYTSIKWGTQKCQLGSIKLLPNGTVSYCEYRDDSFNDWDYGKGFFTIDLINGTYKKENLGLECSTSKYVTNVCVLPNGNLYISYYNGTSSEKYIVDYNFTSKFSIDVLTSPWYCTTL